MARGGMLGGQRPTRGDGHALRLRERREHLAARRARGQVTLDAGDRRSIETRVQEGVEVVLVDAGVLGQRRHRCRHKHHLGDDAIAMCDAYAVRLGAPPLSGARAGGRAATPRACCE